MNVRGVGKEQKLYVETVRRVKRVGRQIAKELHINGPFNIQFMARDNDILVRLLRKLMQHLFIAHLVSIKQYLV